MKAVFLLLSKFDQLNTTFDYKNTAVWLIQKSYKAN